MPEKPLFGLTDDERIALSHMSSHGGRRNAADQMALGQQEFDEMWRSLADKLEFAEPQTVDEYALLLEFERAARSRLEGELWASEARLNALMDIAPEAIMVINGHTGRILRVNDRALQLLGYSARDMVGRLMEFLVPQELQEIHVSYRRGFLNSVRKRELGYHPPIEAVCRDGTIIRLDIALTATAATDDVMVVCNPVVEQERPRDGLHSASELERD
ncbi:MAG TPA: PAS domain S-box protein [Fimbriimonadaceae bacterium]|nr:PAS domain S-box protein [Fimbriimonadaceae bacterium]